MSEACTHDCSNCHADCSSRAPQHEPPHAKSHIKKVIGVVSGKGGVGKSMTSAMMAVSMRRKGYKVGVLDADITGPSIPKLFGVHGPAMGAEDGINPVESHTGIKIMSINLLLEHDDQPVVWRGPVLAGAVTQFWTDVVWGDLDYLFIDMPPGTGDVPLTIYQTIPLDGGVIVSTPQTLVQMVVEKARKMAEMLNVPLIGMVENMSCVLCPDCGKHIPLFGDQAQLEQAAQEMGLPILAQLPLNPSIARLCDEGEIERVVCEELDPAADAVEALLRS